MPKCAFPGTVEIVDTEEKAVAACAYLMAQSALGFDTETRPSFKAGVSNRTALLQLASADRCFLFRLSQMKFVREVARVLESGDVVKVGAAVRDDIKGLQRLRWFRPQGFVDLQSVAGGVGHRGEERPQARGDSARQFGFQGAAAEQLGSGHSHESANRVCGDGCLGLSGDI